MDKIGQGWQYTTYDLGNGRVRKVRSPRISQFLFIRRAAANKDQQHSFRSVLSEMRLVYRRALEANAYVKKIMPTIGPATFGNPIFLNEHDYEQDKTITLGTTLEQVSLAAGKQLLDQYPRLIHRMWQYGFSDMMFNFVKNTGVYPDRTLFLMDFGELVFTKQDVSEQIGRSSWLGATPFKRFPEGELKEHYRKIMAGAMTLSNLERLWGSSSRDIL